MDGDKRGVEAQPVAGDPPGEEADRPRTRAPTVQALEQALRHAEQALRESEERYALITAATTDGLWEWDRRTGEIRFSSRWKSILGFTDAEIGPDLDEWLGRVHPEDRGELDRQMDAFLLGAVPTFESEHRVRHKDGGERWIKSRGVAVRGEDGVAHRVVGAMTDVSAFKSTEARLLYEASHDTLTGQPNRVLFLDRLTRRIERGARGERSEGYAVIFLDVDRFKVINDSLGHLIGDQVLVTIAHKLRAAVGPADTVSRLSGDEFGILLDEVDGPAEPVKIAERIRDALAEPTHIDGHEIFTEVSLGIALSTPRPDSAEHLLRDADTAMHRAKRRRESRYEVFDPHMHAQALALLRIETDLRRAVSRAELVLHYQPIVDLVTGRITGLEALVRWRHPVRGLIGPVEFIGLAEETGLIIPIGSWVLAEASRQMRALAKLVPTLGALGISVNLSGRQLANAGFVHEVERARAEVAEAGATLHLEITETVLIENAPIMSGRLHDLRALGVGLHIDDFGTGYSSLSVLQTFPIDTLKIDRSFVSRLGEKGTGTAVVEAIITIARSLDLRVVAEGIETAEQLALLRERGCHDGQGYFFSRPLDFDGVRALLAAAPRW